MRLGPGRAGAWVVTTALLAVSSTPIAGQVPGAIDSLARTFVAQLEVPGMAMAWVTRESRGVWTEGVRCAGDGEPVTGDTGFEIGSVTKALVGTLLAVMVDAGQVEVDEPVASLLPDTVGVPSLNHRPVTLRHLVTHTAGLPRLPANLRPADPTNPYAGYTLPDLFEYLDRAPLIHAPGSAYLYSNIGYGILGVALARWAGASLDEALRDRLLRPLGMTRTYLSSPAGQERDAVKATACGHVDGAPTRHWTWDALAGAGAARSTPKDMLRLLDAQLDPGPHAPHPAIQRSQGVLARPPDALPLAYGWHLLGDLDDPSSVIHFHNGGTGGFRSFVAFARGRGTGIVILANQAVPGPVLDGLGLEILETLIDLPPGR